MSSKSRSSPKENNKTPIRKLYVTRLPKSVTRQELMQFFAKYGPVKHCYVSPVNMNKNMQSTTYAFVTFVYPFHAKKALRAPHSGKCIHGKSVAVVAADSWHQPIEKPDGVIIWKPHRCLKDQQVKNSHEDQQVPSTSNDLNSAEDPEQSNNILTVLNRDCIRHIFEFVPLTDLLKSECVSKHWRSTVHDYLNGMRLLDLKFNRTYVINNEALRNLLIKVGGGNLHHLKLYGISPRFQTRIPALISKFCPMLRSLESYSVGPKNWNSVLYGCKYLKSLKFTSCVTLISREEVGDYTLAHALRKDSLIESLTIEDNAYVTGSFLEQCETQQLKSLTFDNCRGLEFVHIINGLKNLTNLTALKILCCASSTLFLLPDIAENIPTLKELALCGASNVSCKFDAMRTQYCMDIKPFPNLIDLDLNSNAYICDESLIRIVNACPKLESLNISNCNSVGPLFETHGVTCAGVRAVATACGRLRALDVSQLRRLQAEGVLALATASRLRRLSLAHVGALQDGHLLRLLHALPHLQDLDIANCTQLTSEVIKEACSMLEKTPRELTINIYGTLGINVDEITETHRLLKLISEPRNVLFIESSMYTESSDTSASEPDYSDYEFESSDEFDQDDWELNLGFDDNLPNEIGGRYIVLDILNNFYL